MIVKLLIVELGLPLSIVDRSSFIPAMHIVDPHFLLSSRRTIARSTLPTLHDQMVTVIKNRCLSANYLAASLDYWTDRRMRRFFSATAHTINNGSFESYVLDYSSMEESHNPSPLSEHKRVRLVTDNASNVTSAFKDLIVPVFDAYFSTMETADDGDNEQQIVQLDDAGITSVETSWGTDDSDVDEFLDINLNRSVALRIPCFAHSIQLCVRDGLKAASKTVCSALSKAAQIVKRSHTSTKLAVRFEQLKTSVPSPCATRWNS